MPFFDASEVEPQEVRDFEAIPAGDYRCVIDTIAWKSTKSGNGRYLEVVLQVVDGEFKGRLLWDRLNLENPNAQAVEIAKRSLSAICHAVHVIRPNTPEELCNKPLIAKVTRKISKYNGELQNEIKGYSASQGPGAKPAPKPAAKPQDTPYSQPDPWTQDAINEAQANDDGVPF